MLEPEASRKLATEFVREFCDATLPKRTAHGDFQPLGSATCGVYVIKWMKEICRRLLGEVSTMGGWPTIQFWTVRLRNFMLALESEQGKLALADLEALEKMALASVKKKATEAKAKEMEDMTIKVAELKKQQRNH